MILARKNSERHTNADDLNPGETVSKVSTLILGVALAQLLIIMCFTPNPVNDLFWQLRTGHDICLNHRVPHFDAYSWTRSGSPWVVHEWLSFVIFWKSYELIQGFSGVWCFECAIILVSFLLLYLLLYRRNNFAPIFAFLQTASIAILAENFFQPRPQIFTYLCLIVLVSSLVSVQRGTCSRNILVLTPLLFVVWSNLHSGSLVGVAIIFLFMIGNMLELLMADGNSPSADAEIRAKVRYYVCLGIICLIATFVTPYGWHEHSNFFATLQNGPALKMVGEWQAPSLRNSDGQRFTLVGMGMLLGLIFTKRRRYASEIITILVVSYEALMYVRNIPLFAVVAGIITFPHVASAAEHFWLRLTYSEKDMPHSKVQTSLSLSIVVLAAAFSIAIFMINSFRRPPVSLLGNIVEHSFALSSFPNNACHFMEAEGFPRSMHLMNDYNNGGYLIWRLPQYPDYIDGRADLYSSDFLTDYSQLGVTEDWNKQLDSYRVDVIMTTSDRLIVMRLSKSPNWVLVYKDATKVNGSQTVIYVRQTPNMETLIQRCLFSNEAGVARSTNSGVINQ